MCDVNVDMISTRPATQLVIVCGLSNLRLRAFRIISNFYILRVRFTPTIRSSFINKLQGHVYDPILYF